MKITIKEKYEYNSVWKANIKTKQNNNYSNSCDRTPPHKSFHLKDVSVFLISSEVLLLFTRIIIM